jgi:hypothetical protein
LQKSLILLKYFILGSPPLSSEATITFTIVPRNEYSPICEIDNNSTSLSIMENSKLGTILSTILCHDDDKDGLNGQISVYPRWLSDEKQDNKTQLNIPFEIVIRRNNSFEVTIDLRISD